ncbi:wall-associated receptor kinase 2-like [Bidens hawaiensis]|uniref:wall-associated receptor kinase 2-like n=1 Tax=Bidens hawaiensis TaxID=980011 RepID=UPI00404960C1
MKLLVLLMLALFLTIFTFTASANNETYNLVNYSTNLAKPGCDSRCGDLTVPYPFGLNSNCAIDKRFVIYCNRSLNPARPSFTRTGYNSIKLISDSTLQITNLVGRTCKFLDGSNSSIAFSFNFTRWPYTISTVNKFTVLGCDGSAWLTSRTKDKNLYTGCMVFCTKPEEVGDADCTGNGCCRSSISQDINYYTTRISSLRNSSERTDKSLFAPCTYAFLGDPSELKFKGAVDLNDISFKDRIESDVPIVLDWAIGTMSCAQANGTTDFACKYSNSTCVDSAREAGGYRCECKQGYEGNPYLYPGCQDINECDVVNLCYGVCKNNSGNYTCNCEEGYSGDPMVKDGCRRKPLNVLHLSLGLGLGFLTLLTGLSLLHIMVKQRKLIKLREQLFEQNGGVLLESKLKTTGRSVMKIFQVEELEKATNNYAEDNILGKGGNGTVYKGTLLDTRIVAIKKSQRLDQGQRDQFINEMVILAQINHPNVVQLLGCCLETDVPLLAYEFVSNDTLHSHIRNRSGKGRLSWDIRLRIAHESAGALAYLHNDARMSIIHRDVKSTNILLDENYVAKIADFGASRLVPLGHDQVTTLVQGTIGYLDPEYFHTGHLTDKSDVYSFGVVLAELLTGRKPIDPERGFDDINLATYFLKVKKENRLVEILDHLVVKEATDEQLKAMCDLVCRCLSQVGADRPSMKDVTMELETLRKSGKHHPWFSQENYTKTSSFMIESEEHDTHPLVATSDTFGEYSSSSMGMKDIMLHLHSPR